MATKKECDRCGKQWDPNLGYKPHGDSELATVDVLAPYQSSRYDRPLLSKCYELCQACVRHIISELGPLPTITPQPVPPIRQTSTAAEELKRIAEEPDE